MNDSCHIPRAYLSTSNASQDNMNINFNASTISTGMYETPASESSRQNFFQKDNIRTEALPGFNQLVNYPVGVNENIDKKQIKRASHSSQGSNDSRFSSQSAYTKSLLLTLANLEKLAEVHRQKGHTNIKSHLSSNLLLSSQRDIFLSIQPNLKPGKAKETDTMSIASSTHFTIVNAEGGFTRKSTEGICSRGKQVTVVIVTMSIFFLIVILSMVYALEVRARDMRKN